MKKKILVSNVCLQKYLIQINCALNNSAVFIIAKQKKVKENFLILNIKKR